MTQHFITEDWTAFRGIDTLCRKAGVSPSQLGPLVFKELVDNAKDSGAKNCKIGKLRVVLGRVELLSCRGCSGRDWVSHGLVETTAV